MSSATLQETQSQVLGSLQNYQTNNSCLIFNLALLANYRISPTFHVSLLKPAGGSRGVEDQEEAGDQGAPPIIIDGEEVYRVQEVLDSRRRGKVLHYLVDWEGYGPEERPWVNAEDILDQSLTTDFHRAHPNKPAPRPRGRPRCSLPPRVRSRSRGGLCHKSGLCGSLRSPPEGSFT